MASSSFSGGKNENQMIKWIQFVVRYRLIYLHQRMVLNSVLDKFCLLFIILLLHDAFCLHKFLLRAIKWLLYFILKQWLLLQLRLENSSFEYTFTSSGNAGKIILNFSLPELKSCNQAAILRADMVADNTAQSTEHFFPHGNVASINYRLCGSTLYITIGHSIITGTYISSKAYKKKDD